MSRYSDLRAMLWRLSALALLLALAPLASALAGSGDLRVDGVVRLDGASDLSAPDLALVAAPGAGSRAVLEGTAPRLFLDVVRWREETAANPAGAPLRVRGAFESERHEFSQATITLQAAPSGSMLALLAEDLSTPLTLTDARVRGVSAAVLYPGLQSGGASTAGTGGEALEVSDTVEFAAREARGALAGGFVLRADGATLAVAAQGGSTTFTSGREETAATPATRTATHTLLLLTWAGTLDLHLAEGRIDAYALGPVRAGTLAADAADGSLLVDGERRSLSNQALGLGGDLEATFTPAAGRSALADERGVTYAPGVLLAVTGDFTTITLASSTLRAVVLPAAGGILGAAVLVAAAWYWPLIKFGLTAAYTRLREPELLDNEVRNGIYGIIKGNPGISARSIHRESGQSWGTVVYHLRQLERHQLVKSCRVGRLRTFYERNGRYNGMEDGFAAVQNEKTRGVARLIAVRPGITQEQLTRFADLPQSTVSYYVRKLKQARLVDERRVGKYAAYFPAENLRDVLAAVDPHEPLAPGLAPAPSAG